MDRAARLKRRGILAGVAALVAGVATKASTQPALAAGPLNVDTFNAAQGSTLLQRDVGLGESPTFWVVNNVLGPAMRAESNSRQGLYGSSTSGTVGQNSGVFGTATIGPGVTGNGGGSSVGVFGTSPNAGIYGTSNQRGVWGHTDAATQAFYATARARAISRRCRGTGWTSSPLTRPSSRGASAAT